MVAGGIRILDAGPSRYLGVIVKSMLLLGIYILASVINCIPTMLNNLKFYFIADSNVSVNLHCEEYLYTYLCCVEYCLLSINDYVIATV